MSTHNQDENKTPTGHPTDKAAENDLEKDLEDFIERKQHEKQALIKLLRFVEVKGNKQKK
jgi:hypothetical protein